MEDYYQILQVNPNADIKEIKNAYVKMIRKFPPEKEPEQFKRIRKAYEVLSDNTTRDEYDAYSQYGEEIELYTNRGNKAYEEDDYKTAIREFKKILLLQPNLLSAKNMLGLSLLMDGQYDAALRQFKELVNKAPNNSIFLTGLGFVYRKLSDFSNAINCFIKAHNLDSSDDRIVSTITELYLDYDKHDEAISYLRNCIIQDGIDDFQDFIYYFELVKVYLAKNDLNSVQKTFNKIELIVADDRDYRHYVVVKFIEFASILFKADAYNYTFIIVEWLKKFDVDNEAIKGLYDLAYSRKVAVDKFNILNKDSLVSNGLKRIIALWLTNNLSESERDKYLDNIMEEIQSDSTSNISFSINRIKSQYYELYDLNQEFFDKLYTEINKRITSNSSSSYSNSSSSSNYSNSSNNSSSEGGGCLIPIVCALIGTAIAPGLGTIVGLIIGFYFAGK